MSKENMFTFTKTEVPIEFEDTSYCELYQTETILPYIIKQNKEIVGYLFAEKNDSRVLTIQFIEVLDSLKEQGLGTEIVQSLFQAFDVDFLQGSVMQDDEGRAYYFWESLGSEMSVSMRDYEKREWEDDILFTLANQAHLEMSTIPKEMHDLHIQIWEE